MKIESVRIKNLRSFADETVSFNDYTCLVGPNGAGKSTILCALNIFFREIDNATTDLSQLDLEDFHLKNPDEPIEVTVTFVDLSAEAQQDFANYYRRERLHRQVVVDMPPPNRLVKQFRVGGGEGAAGSGAEGEMPHAVPQSCSPHNLAEPSAARRPERLDRP
jgi:energy-coupling factor transporter ATP-binding protein EcfA2